MEIASEVDEKQLVEEEHFVPERAVFSNVEDHDEIGTQAEFF